MRSGRFADPQVVFTLNLWWTRHEKFALTIYRKRSTTPADKEKTLQFVLHQIYLLTNKYPNNFTKFIQHSTTKHGSVITQYFLEENQPYVLLLLSTDWHFRHSWTPGCLKRRCFAAVDGKPRTNFQHQRARSGQTDPLSLASRGPVSTNGWLRS